MVRIAPTSPSLTGYRFNTQAGTFIIGVADRLEWMAVGRFVYGLGYEVSCSNIIGQWRYVRVCIYMCLLSDNMVLVSGGCGLSTAPDVRSVLGTVFLVPK